LLLQLRGRAVVILVTQGAECAVKAGVAGREGIGIVKSSHRNVRGGPGSDPANRD